MLVFKITNYLDVKAEYGIDQSPTCAFSGLSESIGRSKDAHWCLPEAKISSEHLIIEAMNHQFYVTDVSTNGTLFNGLVMEKNTPMPLKVGDQLRIGSYEIVVSEVQDEQKINEVAQIINEVKKPNEQDDIMSIISGENKKEEHLDLEYKKIGIEPSNELGKKVLLDVESRDPNFNIGELNVMKNLDASEVSDDIDLNLNDGVVLPSDVAFDEMTLFKNNPHQETEDLTPLEDQKQSNIADTEDENKQSANDLPLGIQ